MSFEGKQAIVTGAGSGIGAALRAVERNKALLVKPRLGHAQWIIARLAPELMQRASVRFVARQRAMQAAVPD